MGNRQSKKRPKYFGNKILIDGYVREIEYNLNQDIIPNAINGILFEYFNSDQYFYWIYDTNLISTAKINEETHKLYDIQLINRSEEDSKYSDPANINCMCEDVGMCIARTSNHCDTIFKCGCIQPVDHLGFPVPSNPENKCFSIKIDHYNNTSKINELPKLPKCIAGNCLLYDKDFGLLSIGGYHSRTLTKTYDCLPSQPSFVDPDPILFTGSYNHSNKFYNLSFKTMKWKEFPELLTKTSFTAGIIFNISNRKRLMTVGGKMNDDNKHTKIHLFDFELMKWKKLKDLDDSIQYAYQCSKVANIQWNGSGMCYNQLTQTIYLGGNASFVPFYNILTNKWYNTLPRTNSRYYKNTILWLDSFNNNLLFIANRRSNAIEYIDLRIGKEWTTLSKLHATFFNRKRRRRYFHDHKIRILK